VRTALLLLALLAGCEQPAAPSVSVFELRDVVAPRVAELQSAAVAPSNVAAPSEQVREELSGMLETLTSPRSSMREAVLEDLRSRAELFVGALASAVEDAEQSAEWRIAAIEALSWLDLPAATDALLQSLQTSPQPWVRAQCAWHLTGSKHDRILPRVLLRLRYEVDEETAIALAGLLACFGNYAGVDGVCVVRDRARTPELVALANEQLTALAAAAGVGDGEELRAKWQSGELESRLPALEVSKALEFETWKCIQALGEWDLRVVDDRRFVLTHMNAWVVDALAQTLRDTNVYLRVHAAQCLERMGPRAKAAGPQLLEALGEARTASAAAAALGALGHAPAAQRLEDALSNPRDPELANAAARALGALAQPRSIPALRRAFAPELAADLRQAAAEALLALDPSADVVEFLVGRMTAARAEALSAESALGRRLLEQSKAQPERFAGALAQWLAADKAESGSIPTREQLAERLAARASIAREALR